MTFKQFIKGLAVAILILVLIFAVMLVAAGSMLFQGTKQAIQPVQDASNYLSTQVADVLHPTPTVIPDPVTVIREVRSLARLETVQYTMEKVITTEVGQGALGFLFGDKLLFVAHGDVIAGVDLEKLEPDQMWVENGVLKVRLPKAEIFVVRIDNELSYVYNRDTGILRRGDINLENRGTQAAEAKSRSLPSKMEYLTPRRKKPRANLYRLLTADGQPSRIFVED